MKIHIVKEGDTLYELSKKYDVSLAKIIDANPQLVDPNKLDIGAKIKIPTEPVPVPGGSQPIIHKHTVKQGDSLWKLSKAWGITLKEIIDANPQLKNPNALLVGEVVNIPSSSVYTEAGAEDGILMGSEAVSGKKKPGSKEYTGVKEELTEPIVQPPEMPKLPEIAPLPEVPKMPEPEIKKEVIVEIKPEYTEIKPEIKVEYKPEFMPEIKMPEFKMPEYKPEMMPEHKKMEYMPKQVYPIKQMPQSVLPAAEPYPKVGGIPFEPLPYPSPEFPVHHHPFHGAPHVAMPVYGYPVESPCGCHEPAKWHGESVHPYHQIPQEAVPVSYGGEGWEHETAGYPGLSGEQPVSLEYSQISITESYTAGAASHYQPYPEHQGVAPYGYTPSPCGCHGGEVNPLYGTPAYGYPHHGHHMAPDYAVPYHGYHGAMRPSAYGAPSEPPGAFGAYPAYANPYDVDWKNQGVGIASALTDDATSTVSSELESEEDSVIQDDAAEGNSGKSKAKVNRQHGGKGTRPGSRRTRKPAKNKKQNPWIKG